MRWPRDYRRKAAAVVPVERAALGGIRYVCIGRKNTNALRQRAIVPRRVLYHVPRQKTNTTAIDPIVHPHGSDRRLLPPLNNNLHLPKAHHDIVLHHHPAVKRVLLTGAPLITTLRPNNLHNNARWMVRLLGNRDVRGRRRTFFCVLLGCISQQLARPHCGDSCASCTRRRWALGVRDGAAHRARRRSLIILGKGAGAAPPETARGGRGGGHRVSCLCCVSARSYFFHAHSHICAKICPTDGILGIAGKLLIRRTHLACLLNAIV